LAEGSEAGRTGGSNGCTGATSGTQQRHAPKLIGLSVSGPNNKPLVTKTGVGVLR
jgi:hypothetical protein